MGGRAHRSPVQEVGCSLLGAGLSCDAVVTEISAAPMASLEGMGPQSFPESGSNLPAVTNICMLQ